MKKTADTETNLGHINQIPPGEGRIFDSGPEPVTVFRSRKGEVFAVQALCPHKRGPLVDGLMGGGQIICPMHGYKFDLASGDPIGNDCGRLRTYPVRTNDIGEILIDLRVS